MQSLNYEWYQNILKILFTAIADNTIVSGILSGIGSFLGGLVGAAVAAYVAFKISRDQIKIEKDKNELSRMNKVRNNAKALQNELLHNQEVYNIVAFKKKQDLLNTLETFVWDKIRFECYEFLKTVDYDMIEVIYREIKNLKNEKFNYYEEGLDLADRIEAINKITNNLTDVLNDIDKQKLLYKSRLNKHPCKW